MPVLWFDEIPGGWTYFYEEAERLARHGHEVVVVVPHSGKQYSGRENVRVYRCSSIYLVARAYVINIFGFVKMMLKVIGSERPFDIVYDTTSGILPLSTVYRLWFMMKRKKTPIIVHIHGEMKDLRGMGLLSTVFEIWLNVIARTTYRIADKVLIADKRLYRRAVELGAQPSKISVVHVGTRYSEAFEQAVAPDVTQGLRESSGLSKNDFVIGYVGRPSRAKGVDKLLEVFAVAKRDPRMVNAKVLIIGDGDDRLFCEGLSKGLGISNDVRFLGQRTDVPRLLSIMDIFVNLSQSEAGISATQIEAMQSGLASVVTPFSDYIDNMMDAIVVGEGNTKGTVDALIRLHEDEELRQRLSHNAIVKARGIAEIYSWDVYLSCMDNIFKEIGVKT